MPNLTFCYIVKGNLTTIFRFTPIAHHTFASVNIQVDTEPPPQKASVPCTADNPSVTPLTRERVSRPEKLINMELKKGLYGTIGLAALVLFSSNKKENTCQLYNEQIAAMAGMEQVSGQHIIGDSLNGKMLLLNFWASYDAQSRMNNYHLVQLSETYKNSQFYNGEGLQVVSISLDRYKSPLKKAIETDGTKNFYHICDFKGTESELAKSFDINRPVNLLLDADGKIVARDFNVEALATALEMLSYNE